jgi:hypothetical protein
MRTFSTAVGLTDIPADVDITSHVCPQLDGADLRRVRLTETSETSKGEPNQQTSGKQHGLVGSEEEDKDDGNTDSVIDHE